MMNRCTLITLIVLGVVGILLLVAGIVLHFESDRIIRKDVEERVELKNGSDAYKAWKSPPATIYMQFWVFNVENPMDVINNKNVTPNVTQIGPFTYRELRTKEEIEFLANDSIISYRESKAYVFVPDMSVHDAHTYNFTTVNLPILTAASLLNGLPTALRNLVAWTFSKFNERLFEEHTVHEFLWGYTEKTFVEINKILWLTGFQFPTTVGLFTGPNKNGSDDGIYEIYSGQTDVHRLNQVKMWRNKTSLGFWNTSYCNMLNGTDGSLWHPFINKSQRLYIFSSDICRSINVIYNHTTNVHGIKTYHFVPPPTVFMDHIKNPDNAGFCVPECLESGVLDVSVCKKAPIIVSQPHFYQGSQNYIDAIIGMEPGPQYSTFMDVEPYTGASLRLAKKLQLNAKITKLGAFKDTANFTLTIFPMLWLNEHAELDADEASKFKASVYGPMSELYIGSYVAIAVGAALILAVIIIVIVSIVRNKQPKDEPLIQDDVPRGDI